MKLIKQKIENSQIIKISKNNLNSENFKLKKIVKTVKKNKNKK